ncbi:hypothetical protein [Alkalicoccus daliensis]|uniref:Uncharacterized protein n=1 Tax=Alkalicoccus daliensis TaxID=745820 RepID=A0A1H0H0Q6_9BACI|nr:hypothetical protein [Alkalicoccus daliensis]SDO12511.1 hypothetical protein SAMN04488053_107117 [Alkalicoccus daliensis]
MTEPLSSLAFLNQFWIILLFLIPIVLISRTVVAGTRYSAILIVVIFGLAMGYILEVSEVSNPGLNDFPLVGFMAQTTIIALVASFFVGGQELRKILGKKDLEGSDMVTPSDEEILLGTSRTQFFFIVRAFFILLGVQGLISLLLGTNQGELSSYYPIIAYIGFIGAVILIDNKAVITNKHLYLRKGLLELVLIVGVLLLSYFIAQLIAPMIALPQIFFAMMISAGIGAVFYRWEFGPTMRSLLFAGIPIVLAANFLVGGSRIGEAFEIPGVNAVLVYGFFGQLLWMFGGIALLMFFARTTNARNLAPGMAGALSHSGLTGACTAGDFGKIAAKRAPIMINVPFFGHIFVFSVLAVSADQGSLWIWPALLIVAVGVGLTILALTNLRKSKGEDRKEVTALMQFSFGWQLCAVFGGLAFLSMSSLAIDYAAMAQASAISHFGLFAAIQEGMFGSDAALLIPFVFSMPFLVHPLVFFMFGRAMENNGDMPVIPVYIMAGAGLLGILAALFI